MNERIKKLVKQAGGHISMRNLASNPVQHIESIELWDKNIEKFAELIVKECVRYFNEDYERNFETLWREDLSKGIKEHFGVEE